MQSYTVGMFVNPGSPDRSSLLIPMLVGIIAFIPAMISAVIAWLRDLGAPARRLRTIDEAQKLVAFWESWRLAVKAAVEDSGAGEQFPLTKNLLTNLLIPSQMIQRLHDDPSRRPFVVYYAGLSKIRKALFWYRAPDFRMSNKRFIFYSFLLVVTLEVLVLSVMRRAGIIAPHHQYRHSLLITVPIYAFLLIVPVYYYCNVRREVRRALELSRRRLGDIWERAAFKEERGNEVDDREGA